MLFAGTNQSTDFTYCSMIKQNSYEFFIQLKREIWTFYGKNLDASCCLSAFYQILCELFSKTIRMDDEILDGGKKIDFETPKLCENVWIQQWNFWKY